MEGRIEGKVQFHELSLGNVRMESETTKGWVRVYGAPHDRDRNKRGAS